MLRDVYWRQYPIDLLNDDKMAYIESLMPEEYKFAPYMFYITALKLADNDGIFDLEDGVIFARLMRIKSRALVFQIANLMRQHKILYRLSDDTTLMQLADWTYTDKKVRTAEERRRIVADKINKERAKKANYSQADFSTDGCAGKHNAVPQSESCAGKCNDIPQANAGSSAAPKNAPEAETAAPRRDFLCPDDDKNAKNVGNIQTDSTDSTIQEVQTTHTHTDTQQATGYGQLESPPPEACQTQTAVAVQNNQTQDTQATQMQTPDDANGNGIATSLAAEALQAAQGNGEEIADRALFEYLENYFVKFCYGYDRKKGAHCIAELCRRIEEISDEINPPDVVAGVLCSEFKKMCEGQRNKYWEGQALLPSLMLNNHCWMELMQHAGKILATNSASNKFTESWAKAEAEYQAEREKISVAVREEYVKYNIDPDAANANYLLLQAKSREQEELRKAAEVDAEAEAAEKAEAPADIF